MKKLLAIALSLALTIGASSIAMAAGNGAGLAAAPGQSVNFSKGVTTIITTTVNVVESKENKTVVSDPVVKTENKISTSSTTEDITTTSAETKILKDVVYTRNVTSTQTKTTTTTKSWVDTTTAITTSYYEIPVTTTYTTIRTLKHQGAPGSNGIVISDTSDTKVAVVKGAEVLLSSDTKETTTSGAISENTSLSYSEPVVTAEGWHIGQN